MPVLAKEAEASSCVLVVVDVFFALLLAAAGRAIVKASTPDNGVANRRSNAAALDVKRVLEFFFSGVAVVRVNDGIDVL